MNTSTENIRMNSATASDGQADTNAVAPGLEPAEQPTPVGLLKDRLYKRMFDSESETPCFILGYN